MFWSICSVSVKHLLSLGSVATPFLRYPEEGNIDFASQRLHLVEQMGPLIRRIYYGRKMYKLLGEHGKGEADSYSRPKKPKAQENGHFNRTLYDQSITAHRLQFSSMYTIQLLDLPILRPVLFPVPFLSPSPFVLPSSAFSSTSFITTQRGSCLELWTIVNHNDHLNRAEGRLNED